MLVLLMAILKAQSTLSQTLTLGYFSLFRVNTSKAQMLLCHTIQHTLRHPIPGGENTKPRRGGLEQGQM